MNKDQPLKLVVPLAVLEVGGGWVPCVVVVDGFVGVDVSDLPELVDLLSGEGVEGETLDPADMGLEGDGDGDEGRV